MIDLTNLIGNSNVNENRIKNRIRFHQGWWRAFVLGEEQGKHPSNKEKKICNTVLNGKATKNNFLSEFVVSVVDKSLAKRGKDEAGIINEDRLYNNLLSSQPLCFNFFALFDVDKELALSFLKNFYPELTSVNAIHFEFANAKYKFDNSAFDVAFDVNANDSKGIIGFECKYTDSFSSTPYRKEAYESIYQKSDIWKKVYEELTAPRFNQLFRNQLISESFKQNKQYDFAYLALFCDHKDRPAIGTALEYKSMFVNGQDHHFQIITYRDFFEQTLKLNITWELKEYLMLLWTRYCGLELSNAAYEQLIGE